MAKPGSNVVAFRARRKWTRASDYGAARRPKRRVWRGRGWLPRLSPILIMLPLAAFTAVLVWPGEWPPGGAVEVPEVSPALAGASEEELCRRIWPGSVEELDAQQPNFASGSGTRTARLTDGAAARFSICGGGTRVNCVVDGDTFWYAGEKIRVADINTPEVSEPACAREAALGRAATARLQGLLNAGAFTLEPVDRDRDRYGRLLRTVTRGGESLGEVLVREGLAEEWRGRRGSWC